MKELKELTFQESIEINGGDSGWGYLGRMAAYLANALDSASSFIEERLGGRGISHNGGTQYELIYEGKW